MKKLVFVGNREMGYFCEKIAERFQLSLEYVSSNGHIEQQINEILFLQNVEYVVYDISQYIDSPEVIRDEICKIKTCNGATPIIYASGFLLSSQILVLLYEAGISEFITATNLSDQSMQLEKCINGYYKQNGIEELNALVTMAEQEEQLKAEYKYTSIGVAGTLSRIGTTTQALHIVKYFMAKGYKACYIQLNDSSYIEDLKEWWDADATDDLAGKLTYEGIDHFYKIEQLAEVKKMGYDYYVYDYGALTGHFNRASFLEKDIKIFVMGWKPEEMKATFQLLQSKIYLDVKYILSFGDELPEEDIEGIVGNRLSETVVPKRCSEPYKLYDLHAYDQILHIDSLVEETESKKKSKGFRIFGRGKAHE